MMQKSTATTYEPWFDEHRALRSYFFPVASHSSDNVEDDSSTYVFPTHPRERLAERVDQLCRFARFTYSDIDHDKLRKAQNEANLLAYSGLFSEECAPSVCIDRFGEISFTHSSGVGYIDIGVSGESELSYHVRNDTDPERSVFNDYTWNDGSIPAELFHAIFELKSKITTSS